VVEEKRNCPDCTNTADGVVQDAQDADRESIDNGELERVDAAHAVFECNISYLKHLNNEDSHKALLKNMTSYLWKKKKTGEAIRQIANFAPLLQC
jgi:hypothetical protein